MIQHDGRMNQRGHRERRACYTLTLTVRSGSRQVWGISEAPRCSRKLFKTVKPEITQVSLSMPASSASIMTANSGVEYSGRQPCGQVSLLWLRLKIVDQCNILQIWWILQKQD